MRPLEAPHRNNLRAILQEKMTDEGADAVISAIPASDAEMPATKDFVEAKINGLRSEMTDRFADTTDRFAQTDAKINDLRSDMTDRFAQTDAKINDLRSDMSDRFDTQTRWMVGTAIATVLASAGSIIAAIRFLPL